jgi:hypothetical protein
MQVMNRNVIHDGVVYAKGDKVPEGVAVFFKEQGFTEDDAPAAPAEAPKKPKAK